MLTTGSGRKANSVSRGLMLSMKTSAPAVNTTVLAVYMMPGPDQHAHRIQVVGGARHDVAGAGALIEAVRQPLQMREQIVAQVEFNFARDPDQDPAGKELEDGFGAGDRQQQQPSSVSSLWRVTPRFRSSMARRMTSGKRIQTPLLHSTHRRADPEGHAVLAEIGEQRA